MSVNQECGKAQVWARHGDGSGFSLVELVVVLGIVMVLVSLLMPLLARARLTARELSCVARIRELGNLVSIYATSHDDRFPSALGDGPEITQNRSRWLEYSFQRFSTFPRDPWLRWAGMGPFDEILNCPDYQRFEGQPLESDPDYILTAAAFTEVSYWDPALPESAWRNRLGAKVQRHGAAIFPDRKVGLLEYRVWHGHTGVMCEGCPIEGLFHDRSERPGSLWFLDGHVAQIRGRDAAPYLNRRPFWPQSPMGTTVWGIAGRDIP